MGPDTIHFVSYASEDEARVRALLAVRDPGFLEQCFFAPRSLEVADVFELKIKDALDVCNVFHLFWSENASASDWVEQEMIQAIQRWRELGEPDGFFRTYRLDQSALPKRILGRFHVVDVSGAFDTRPPGHVMVSRLPRTGRDLFGREGELARLDASWDRPDINVLAVVGWGGQGKSALVNRWLANLGRSGYRGAQRVYGWSFYSQGTRAGRAGSADSFVDHALREWFGVRVDPDATPWAKGEQLAKLVRREKTLLVLDGLEPLQFPPGEFHGQLKHPTIQALLKELAASNHGLCVITSRIAPSDLDDYLDSTYVLMELDRLSAEAGSQLLVSRGVKGTAGDIAAAVEEYGGHALALTLLGNYSMETLEGAIPSCDQPKVISKVTEGGDHAHRVMASYERLFGTGPELSVLYLLALFDRPAEEAALAALRASPGIKGLPHDLSQMPTHRWNACIHRLRQAGLVSEADSAGPQTLDCHPLVREYFETRLKKTGADAHQEGHARLHEHYKKAVADLPESLGEMESLFRASRHGCAAGRYHEVLHELYIRRIMRGDEYYAVRRLGAIGEALSLLSYFFEDHDWMRPIVGKSRASKGLSDSDELTCLNHAAVFLIMARGYGASAVREIYARVRHICENTDDPDSRFSALRGLSIYHTVRAEFSIAIEIAEHLTKLAAANAGDTGAMLEAHFARGLPRFYLGKIAEAEVEMAKGAVLYDQALHHRNSFAHGHDPGVACLAFSGWMLVMQGKTTQGQTKVYQALALAKELAHPYSIVLALNVCAIIARLRCEPDRVREHIEEELVIATEKRFAFWLAESWQYKGWLSAWEGDAGDGITQIRRGIDAFRLTGAHFAATHGLYLLSEALAFVGQPDEGLKAAEQGLTMVDRLSERNYAAELHRLKGEHIIAIDASRTDEADSAFREALAVASRQGQRWFELRAARGLLGLHEGSDKEEEARSLLESALDCLPEGHELMDVQRARNMLDRTR